MKKIIVLFCFVLLITSCKPRLNFALVTHYYETIHEAYKDYLNVCAAITERNLNSASQSNTGNDVKSDTIKIYRYTDSISYIFKTRNSAVDALQEPDKDINLKEKALKYFELAREIYGKKLQNLDQHKNLDTAISGQEINKIAKLESLKRQYIKAELKFTKKYNIVYDHQ